MKIKPKVAEIDTYELIPKILALMEEYVEVEVEFIDAYREDSGTIDVWKTDAVWKPLEELLSEHLTGITKE